MGVMIEKVFNWFETHTKTRILLGFIAAFIMLSGTAFSVFVTAGLWIAFATVFVEANPLLAFACVCGSWGLAGAVFGTACDIFASYARKRLDQIQEERDTGDNQQES